MLFNIKLSWRSSKFQAICKKNSDNGLWPGRNKNTVKVCITGGKDSLNSKTKPPESQTGHWYFGELVNPLYIHKPRTCEWTIWLSEQPSWISCKDPTLQSRGILATDPTWLFWQPVWPKTCSWFYLMLYFNYSILGVYTLL